MFTTARGTQRFEQFKWLLKQFCLGAETRHARTSNADRSQHYSRYFCRLLRKIKP